MNENEFQSLKTLIEKELQELSIPVEFKHLDSFITDGKKSAQFIRALLGDKSFDIPEEHTQLYETAEMRARHSAVTFLMGLVFKRFNGLFMKIPTIINQGENLSNQMWLLTSLNHDKAYFSKYIENNRIDLKKKFTPFLLTDEIPNSDLQVLDDFSNKYPDTLAYKYSTILDYDNYAIYYHSTHESKEKRDHGILGGVMMFSELSKRAMNKGKEELTIIKACSLAITQHNIFKSGSRERDKHYEAYNLHTLLSDSPFRISPDKCLLLFLSLVDTVECVKKFSQKQNKDKYFETLTTLKYIKMAVTENEISIDLSELSKRIKEKNSEELDKALKSYKEALIGFDTWTELSVSMQKEIFTIKLKAPAKNEEKVLIATAR